MAAAASVGAWLDGGPNPTEGRPGAPDAADIFMLGMFVVAKGRHGVSVSANEVLSVLNDRFGFNRTLPRREETRRVIALVRLERRTWGALS